MLIRRFISLGQQSFRHRQTQYLLLWLVAAYGAYLFWLGIRPVVILMGALVCVLTIFSWLLSSRPIEEESDPQENGSDLLEPTVFLHWLEDSRALPQGVRLSDTALGYWHKTYAQVDSIHRVAVAIAHQDSLFIPDLLDTLHTVLALSAQFSQAFNAAKQMHTSTYQKVAHRHLRASTHRLAQTYQHLQELHDRLLAADMEAGSAFAASAVSDRLRTLIDANKSELASD